MTVPGVPFLLTPSPGEAWAVDEEAAAVTATAAARTDKAPSCSGLESCVDV